MGAYAREVWARLVRVGAARVRVVRVRVAAGRALCFCLGGRREPARAVAARAQGARARV